MWELDYKESWVPKNWCFWTVVLEKTLESPLHCKESQPVHLKGNQSSIFIQYSLEGLMLKLKLHLIWRTDSFEKTDAGKDWRWEKGMTEDEMVGWHYQLNGHESEYTPGVGDGQRSWHPAVHGASKCWIWLSNWTDCNLNYIMHNGQNNVYLSLLLWWLNELVFASGGQRTGVSASVSVLPMNIQDWFPLGWTGCISLLSKGISNTTVQKQQFFSAQLSL